MKKFVRIQNKIFIYLLKVMFQTMINGLVRYILREKAKVRIPEHIRSVSKE